jgi:phosphoribosylanthranilate isomerase
MRTRVKFCGLVRAQDVEVAVRLGVDAVGLVFFTGSPRVVTVPQAQALRRLLPSFVRAVGLFVNASESFVKDCVRQVGLDVLQFHGDENPDTLQSLAASLNLPWWQVVRMRPETDLLSSAARSPGAECLLLDAHVAGYGGSGQRFDWNWIPTRHPARLILSGGLDAQRVAAGIAHVRPFAVDVSSGNQGTHPREKDPLHMERFMAAVLAADAQGL